jgi:hypothetical protein
MPRKLFIAQLLALLAVLVSGQGADAALGGNAESINADRSVLRAGHHTATSHGGYTVEEIVADATTVREYVTPSGVVFGLAWNGYTHPDLTQLLGTYWGEYSTARRQAVRKTGSRRQQLATGRMIVETWGHMRNLQGRAYLPSLIPTGVSSDDIK